MLSNSTNISALHAAGIVGTWDTDVPAGLSLLDEGAATLLAGNRALAGKPIPLDVAFGRIHPDDREWVFAAVRRVRQTGGPIAIEFRVLAATGEIRWILNRGYLTPDTRGAMRGYGAYIDTTETRRESAFVPPFAASTEADPLHLAADHCMRAHAAIRRSGDTYLAVLVEMLLFRIGRILARQHSP